MFYPRPVTEVGKNLATNCLCLPELNNKKENVFIVFKMKEGTSYLRLLDENDNKVMTAPIVLIGSHEKVSVIGCKQLERCL